MKNDTDTLYYCDPEKNTECKKTYCIYEPGAGECYSTKDPAFARDGLYSFKLVIKAGERVIWERVT